MRAQLAMEFMLSFLVMAALLSQLISIQASRMDGLDSQMKRVAAKNAVEGMASKCNLVYFNWGRADFGFSFNLSNLQILNDTLMIEESGKNVTSRCLSEIGGVGEIMVTGVRRWF